MRVTKSSFLATPNGPHVTGILVAPDEPIALMVLGHGAATPIYKPLMVQMSEALATAASQPFATTIRTASAEPANTPRTWFDPLDVLLATSSSAKSAAQALSLDLPLFVGGRSMSSQVVSPALTREKWPDVKGLVLYVFPMRWRMLLDDTVSHLQQVPVPMLFVQGDRDEEFADLAELRPVLHQLGNRASLHVIHGANHSFNLPAESARTRQDAVVEAASVTSAWMRGRL